MKKRIAIIGAGELGLQILNLILENNQFEVVGFFDDTKDQVFLFNKKYSVLGKIRDVKSIYKAGEFDAAIIGIGYKHMFFRRRIFEKLIDCVPFESVIHKSVIMDSTVKIGVGSVIYPGCILDKNVIIEKNVLLNLGVVVSHDTKIQSHCFIAPRVVFSGFVLVNKACFIGTGSIIIDNLKIESQSIIGAGSVVNRTLENSGVYVGNPVRKIKNIEGNG